MSQTSARLTAPPQLLLFLTGYGKLPQHTQPGKFSTDSSFFSSSITEEDLVTSFSVEFYLGQKF